MGSLAGMLTVEVENIWTTLPFKMRRSPSCWPTLSTIQKGREDVKYAMRVSGVYNEALDRQIMERVQISSFKRPILMNRKNEMGGIRVERTRYRRWGGD